MPEEQENANEGIFGSYEAVSDAAKDVETFDVDGNAVSFDELKSSYIRDRKNTQGLQDFEGQKQEMGKAQSLLAQQSQQYMQALEALDKRLNDRIEGYDKVDKPKQGIPNFLKKKLMLY